MKRFLLASLLFVLPAAAHADANVVFNTGTPIGGLKGINLDRPAGEIYGVGLSWSQSEQVAWCTGMDITQDYPGVPDLVLAYNPATRSDNLRIRADDARTALGLRVGHPVLPFQLDLEPAAANGGLCVGVSGYQWGAYIYNRTPGDNEAAISYDNLWLVGSDLLHTGAQDFGFYSFAAGSMVLQLGGSGGIGFFGAAPSPRPAVTGSWSDGSAARGVLAALVRLGLVSDGTTP